ncbi:nardilysin [Bactrocera oleae]|uniref:nardilysin n=1 Tax=Bactrocera oleae TaxID=104688 RepID=UPI0006B7930B|nr:nardilysin [Bactrocera oleae]
MIIRRFSKLLVSKISLEYSFTLTNRYTPVAKTISLNIESEYFPKRRTSTRFSRPGYFRNSFSTTDMVNTEASAKYLEIPDKSESDKKHYKTLLLSNGIRALLVSDPTPVPHCGLTSSSSSSSYDSTGDSCAEESSSTSSEDEESMSTSTTDNGESDSDLESEEGDEKLAACALLVDVGSFTEPTEYQGLAHFLEHMIFMGSEKYPAENAFDAHIKKCGGFDNAHTEFEETCFYFEVSEEHLDSSMDYFSALLKAPLMKKEAMTRERDSVESEFQQIVHDDEVRRDQLVAAYATPGYPHATFPWGNLKTLKDGISDDDLHAMLHEFQKRHYSAHRMCVCVQARLPIDELEQMVVKHFSGIPSNDLPGLDLSPYNYRDAFQNEFFEEVFFVKPVENICKLELTWVLPSMIKQYKTKPDQFISHLIGYEGEGSLCAYLRKRLWALELTAGIDESGFESNSIYSSFVIGIFLTDRGFQHLDEVLAASFAFIKLFAGCGPFKDAYTELQKIEATNFRFESQRPALDNVEKLAVKMKYYPPKDILTGTELYYEYNEDHIQDVVKHLNEFRFNIMITSQHKYEGVTYDKKEKWFSTEYTTLKMPQKWRELWEKSKPMPELFLPKPNRFISNDFRLHWEENGKPELPSAPKKILQTDICELWFRQDDKFLLPEAYMYFYFISPLLRKDPKNDALCALYERLVKFRLSEELYPATVAGLSYQFYTVEKGIILKVNGYNEKLHLLVDIITKAMVSMREHITEDQFNIFKTDQKKSYFNSLIKPRTLNKDIRLSIVEHIRWPIITKYKCLDSLTLNDVLHFSDAYTSELYLQTLMQGNLTEESAHNVMNSVLTTLNCRNIKETKYIENRTVQLPQGSHFIRCRSLNEDDVNTVMCNFYQIGPGSILVESILDLLMMFVEEPLFDTLRTKEQLGYYVSASVRMNYGIIGYSIAVNSQETKFSAAHVDERIEVFRGKMLQILEEMSEEDFEHVRESLIKIKQVVDISLAEEVSHNWEEITSEEYVFDRRRREVDVLRALAKQDIIDFCLNNERTNLRKLSVQVIGNKDAARSKRAAKRDEENSNEDNAGSSGSETEVDDEELFNALASKLDVRFIPKEGDATTIVDIKDFKENLHIYPFTKTKLENGTERSPMEIIEEC